MPPKAPLPVEAMNLFLRDLVLVGPTPSPVEKIRSYVDTATHRAAQLGVSVIVFGSAGARKIPDGFSRTVAEAQLEQFLLLCANSAESAGIVIAIEPLCKRESNFVNLVGEGAEWVRRINRPGIGLLADTYHMEVEGEPISVLQECADLLVHVHTADTGRKAPGTGHYDHANLLDTLNGIGYKGRLSIECEWDDMSLELPQALKRLS